MKSLKAVLLGLLTVGAISTRAEYLYWQMDWEDTADDADYATLVVLDNTGTEVGTLALASPSPSDPSGVKVLRYVDDNDEYSKESVNVTSVIGTEYQNDTYSFVLRTYDASDTPLDSYGPTPYADIAGSIWHNPPQNPGTSTTWSPTKYAVPEPATGTLFILGSLMLFRRKRA